MSERPARQRSPDDRRRADKCNYKVIEWKECRATVARLEKIVVDLRKYGFILLAALLTAKTLFFLTSSPPKQGSEPALTLQTRVALLLFTMVLIFSLFVVDLSQEVLLRAARRRAIALEKDLRMELTSALREQVIGLWSHSRGIWLYSSLVLASFFASVLTTIPIDAYIEVHHGAFFAAILLITVVTLGALYWHHARTMSLQEPTGSDAENRTVADRPRD
jgi:hypothetical protein